MLMGLWCIPSSQAQNVFNPADPLVKYDATKPLGSPERPDTSKAGLQKFVYIPTNGVSTGSNSWDVSSFKSYYFNYNGRKFAFRLKFPRSYINNDSASKKYPMMLFFHGAGEVGCAPNGGIYNNEKQLALGAQLFKDRVDNNLYDGFLLYPQLVLSGNSCWGDWGGVGVSTIYNALLKLVDSMTKYTRLDRDRVMVSGLSAGGVAAYNMARGYPQHIAGIAPSAATGSTTNIPGFVHVPIWFATGMKDNNPSPTKATNYYNTIKNAGADIRFTLYKNAGHAVWNLHWKEADYVPFMNTVHKANPLVFYQRDQVCADSSLEVKLGISATYHSYEWERNNVIIARRTGSTNTVLDPSTVIAYTGNEIVVNNYGTYRVRFRRTASGPWSAWSPKPAVLRVKTITAAEEIQIDGLHSKVLPAPDGSTTVPLILPEGFINYQWYRVSDNSLVSTEQRFNAPAGTYKARYSEPYGCGSAFSPNFVVVNANATPKPNAVTNLTAVPGVNNTVKLTWKDNSTNETGFEVYRSSSPGGPYQLIVITARNTTTYTDPTADEGNMYYYIVRTINNTSGSVPSNEAAVKSEGDIVPPTAPSNLQYRGSTISSVFLRWQPSSDDGGIKRYDIYVNGVKTFSTNSTQVEMTGLDSLTLYAFTVKAVDNSGNVSAASNQAVGYTHHQGTNYTFYTGTYSVLPNYNALTPIKSGVVDTITFGEAFRTQINYYGILYTGYIYAPQTATYTFELYSDDGSKLYIGTPYAHNAPALVNNDSVHTGRTRTGTIQLSAGYHSIALAYFDRVGSERLQLFWSNNAGLSREAIPKNFYSLSSTSVPAAPAAPQAFAATGVDHTKIRLTWQDKSNNETGFEISRSTTQNGNFTPVFTTGAGQVQYIDSGLNASTRYYYRLRSIGLGGSSDYSIADASTSAAPLTPANPTNLMAQSMPGGLVALSWTDNASNETAYLVYRRAGNNGSFVVVATLGSNATAYTDANVNSGTQYFYYVVARNASGNSSPSNTATVSAGNQAPVFGQLDNIFVKAGSTINRDFTVTDAAGDVVSVSLLSAPAFVSLKLVSGSTYRLTVSTSECDKGTYPVQLKATDNKGGVSEVTISVIISDRNTRSVFLNFGISSNTMPAPWNNWVGTRAANSTINGLKDEQNQSTTFAVTALTAWRSTAVNGHITGNNSGVFPDTVLMGGITDTALQLQFRISGLNTAMRYNLVFAGSQNEGIEAISEYSSGTITSRLDARYNTTKTANLNGLVPDANGRITVTIRRLSAGSANFLNAMVIEEYDPSVAVISPANLFAEVALDGRSIMLSWSDRSSNEAASNGFFIERAQDSLFKSGLLTRYQRANTPHYTDTDLAANTRYWYRVRAKNTSGRLSAYSNKATVVTAATVVKVNFNYTVPSVNDSSWNNTLVSPTFAQTLPVVKDHTGNTTSIVMQLEENFNGEFNAGQSTGNDSGVVPDNALLSNYWLDNTQVSTIRLSGLNHTQRYRFGFFGSSSPDGWFKGNYTATYTINGRTVYLNSWRNTTKLVYIDDVAPDENGELLLNFSTTATALYGFNAGMIIHAFNADSVSSVPAIPGDSAGSIVDSPDVDIPAVEIYKVRIYPNPFMEVINVEFHNEKAGGKVRTEIHDLNGRLVHRRHFNSLPEGNNTLSLFTGDAQFRHGTYMLSILVDDKIVKSIKIVRSAR